MNRKNGLWCLDVKPFNLVGFLKGIKGRERCSNEGVKPV